MTTDPKSGEFFDVCSNTHYLRNRYYNPSIGRFTTIDPARDGHNWYIYCGNNPIVFVDPLGLSNVPAWMDWNDDGIVDTAEDYKRFDRDNNNIADWNESVFNGVRYKNLSKTAYSFSNHNYLNIEHQKSFGADSCWTGPSVMAIDYLTQTTYDPKEYAQQVFEPLGREVSKSNNSLNLGGVAQGLRNALENSRYEVIVGSGDMSYFQITNIIDSGSPIIICEEAEYALHSNIQHAVLIQGYAYEENNPLRILVIDDPTNSATKLEYYNNVRFNGYIYFKKRS